MGDPHQSGHAKPGSLLILSLYPAQRPLISTLQPQAVGDRVEPLPPAADRGSLQDRIDIQRDKQEARYAPVSGHPEVASPLLLLVLTFQKCLREFSLGYPPSG